MISAIFIARFSKTAPLQSSLLQSLNKTYVEFSDVEAVDVLAVQVDHVGMGDSAETAVGQEVVIRTPLEGFFADKAVVVAVKMLYEVIAHVQREPAVYGVVQFRAEALGEDAVELVCHRFHLFVELLNACFCQIGNSLDEIRVDITCELCAFVICRSDGISEILGCLVHKVLREFAAVVRCIDGRKRCNIRCHAEHGDAVSAVQTALAVSDDVDLLGTCLFQTLNDGFLDLQSACVDVTWPP